jgi:hypothetical protein
MRRLVFAGFAQVLIAAAGLAQTPNMFPNHPAANPTHVAPDPFRPQTPGLLPPLKATPTVQPQPTMPGEPTLLPPQLRAEVTLPQKETLARIDANGMTARRVGDRWAVVNGFVTVRDFGKDEAAAAEFVKVLRDLRPTDWGTVGTARVVVEYGLTGGKAQQPAFTPKTSVAVDEATLRVESVRGVWVVRDDENILLNFGREQQDAEQAVGVIRKYGFNRIGQVGAAGSGVTFLFAQEVPAANRARPKAPAATGVYADLQKAIQEQRLTRTGIDVPGDKPDRVLGGRLGSPETTTPVAAETVGEKVAIDPKAVELKRDGADWKLVHGQDVLANFGPSEWSGRDALKLVQDQRFTEFCRFNSEVTFFLVNGQAPTKVPFAVQATRFDRDAVKVKAASGGRYGLYEGSGRQLFACDTQKEAEQLLRLLQSYGFDTSCQIGLGTKSSLRFLAKTGR